jgi:hypothetical protein
MTHIGQAFVGDARLFAQVVQTHHDDGTISYVASLSFSTADSLGSIKRIDCDDEDDAIYTLETWAKRYNLA